MNFDWKKKCIVCHRKVWQACIVNTRCLYHCVCPDNVERKKIEIERKNNSKREF